MDGNTKVKIIHEYQGGKGRSKISAVRDYMPYFYSVQSFPQAHMPHSLSVQSLLHWRQEPHTLGLLPHLNLSAAVVEMLAQVCVVIWLSVKWKSFKQTQQQTRKQTKQSNQKQTNKRTSKTNKFTCASVHYSQFDVKSFCMYMFLEIFWLL